MIIKDCRSDSPLQSLLSIPDNLHALQQVEKPNPPAPLRAREGGARNIAPLSS